MRQDNTRVFNMDCMEYIRKVEDGFFELAIVDPPYGIGESGGDKKRNRNYKRIVKHNKKEWDISIPSFQYFNELFRVSKNQIIWGANYMIDHLYPTMGWIYWDKRIGGDFSDGELAWTSFQKALRSFSYSHVGDTKGGHTRIHPTQKPVPLYTWLLINYAKEGDKILDTHLGSGSSRIAAYNLGFDFTGLELDKEYFDASCKRFDNHKKQLTLF